MLSQEPRVAKRQRGGDIDSSAAGPSGAAQQQGSGAANGDAPAEHMDISFASAGPQDVNTINETGSTMAAAASAPPQQPQVCHAPLPVHVYLSAFIALYVITLSHAHCMLLLYLSFSPF